MKKKKFTISDLDGFADICNETQLFAVNAGCASENPNKTHGGGDETSIDPPGPDYTMPGYNPSPTISK